MSDTPVNQAAWMSAPQVSPLEVGPAPYPTPGPGQLVIQNAALGVNPIDFLKQMLGGAILGHITYPVVIGEDVAGTVVAVGGSSSRFRVGDRVVAIAAALTSNDAAEGGFQLYTLAREWLTVPLPAHVTFAQACALPLALLTAGVGLFSPDYLGLDLPQVGPATATASAVSASSATPAPPPSRVVIVAGAASAVGGTAIQLARAAGYDVVSTSSPANFALAQRLGASQVFDYASGTIADDLAAAVLGRELCGCYALGDDTADVFATVIARHKADGRAPTCTLIARAEGKHSVDEAATGIQVKFVVSGPVGVGPDSPVRPIIEDFLPTALETKQFVPTPEPLVVGQGLDKLQEAFDVRKKGVSAKKVVVTL